jgi:phage/plasmid-associated DNA primase
MIIPSRSNANPSKVVAAQQLPAQPPLVEKHFNQIAFEALYTDDRWISVRGDLHRYVGTHHEKVDDEVETRRISDFCNSYFEPVNKNQNKHTKATHRSVLDVLNWAKTRLAVDPKLVNPPGLNCANGVLELSYNKATGEIDRVFSPHSPDVYHTYVSDAVYDPSADRTEAERLMECLDALQREIMLRTLAACLNLRLIRKLHGDRSVRALLAFGEGENGKDTIRVVMQRVLSHAVTGVAIAAFKTYDQGKKFPVAPLERSRLNWSSENSGNIVIDEVQSLKQAISGDTLACERKNKDEYDFEPESIFIFNLNKLPTIIGDLHAIRSRYGILSFNKTFTSNPTKPSHIKADPRFKRDPEFIKNDVLPGFLMMLLDAFDRLTTEGIDYGAIDATFDETRRQSSHLHQFCQDVGLIESEGDSISVKEAYEVLRQWYLDNDLAFATADGSLRFHEMEHWSDTAVKTSAHLFNRLKTLFPGIERSRTKTERRILGLRFASEWEMELAGQNEQSLDSGQSVSKPPDPAPIPDQPHPFQPDQPIERQMSDGNWSNGYRFVRSKGDRAVLVHPELGECPVKLSEIRACQPATTVIESRSVLNPPPNRSEQLEAMTPNSLQLGDKVHHRGDPIVLGRLQGKVLEVAEIGEDGSRCRLKSGGVWSNWIESKFLVRVT